MNLVRKMSYLKCRPSAATTLYFLGKYDFSKKLYHEKFMAYFIDQYYHKNINHN